MICSNCIHNDYKQIKMRNSPTYYHFPIFQQQYIQPKQYRCSATYHSKIFATSGNNYSTSKQNQIVKAVTQDNFYKDIKCKQLQQHKTKMCQNCPNKICNMQLKKVQLMDKWKQNIWKEVRCSSSANVSKMRKIIDLSSNLNQTQLNNIPYENQLSLCKHKGKNTTSYNQVQKNDGEQTKNQNITMIVNQNQQQKQINFLSSKFVQTQSEHQQVYRSAKQDTNKKQTLKHKQTQRYARVRIPQRKIAPKYPNKGNINNENTKSNKQSINKQRTMAKTVFQSLFSNKK